MSYERNVRRTTTTRRPLYAPPPPPPGSHNRNHSVLGYWVPLVTIGTIAVGGLAAWIWSERSEQDDDYPHDKPQRPPGPGGPYPTQGSQPYPGPAAGPNAGGAGFVPLQEPTQPPQPIGADVTGTTYGGGSASAYYDASSTTSRNVTERNDASFLGRVMRRTPSPQQFFDNASKQVMGGMAAAGKALGSIMEVDSRDHSEERRRLDEREGFSDHERWSEEAEDRQRIKTVERDVGTGQRGSNKDGKGRAKRIVAIVVSADVEDQDNSDEGVFHTEHGSILSHLPEAFNPELTDLFVLIYAPSLKTLPSTSASSVLGSSYSNISTPAQTPGSELQSISPRIEATNPTFDNLQQQAQSLVDHPTKIMPFTTPAGYVSILRHLAPQIVYISDTLSGREGETVAQLKGWVGHTVLVVGDEGHGGLADTETETETEDDRKRQKKSEKRWWEHSSIVGLGKEIDVVDAMRVGDDWARRVNGRE